MIGGRLRRRHSVLPGFGLAMGFTVLYLSLIVLLPLSAVVFKSATVSWAQFWTTVSSVSGDPEGVLRAA